MQLAPITLIAPGSLGLNTEEASGLLDARWSTVAENMVLDKSGLLAARKGWASQTVNKVPGNAPITAMHEWITGGGAVQIVVATENKIFSGINDFADSGNDITPASPPSAGNWKFINFNGKVVGFQRDHAPIVYSGGADFAPISGSGIIPDGHAGTAAFGRLWIVDDDRQTIRYCALLDETDWDGPGAGLIDMRTVWTQGMDEVTAIASLGANLVVFGSNHIVFWGDGSGSELGMDPDNMVVVDTIEGTGCIARDSVQAIGEGDLAFLSRHGVQSLARLIQTKSNPLETLTKNVRGFLQDTLLQNTNHDEIRSVFHPSTGLYILTFPTAGVSFVLNMRKLFRDDDGHVAAPVTNWLYGTHPTSWVARQNGDLLLGLAGEVGLYTGSLDGGAGFSVTWKSGWLDLGPQVRDVLKILKEIRTKVSLSATAQITWNWEFDFDGNVFSQIASYGSSELAEWGEAEWGEAEWAGGVTIHSRTLDGSSEGQFIRVGMIMPVTNTDLLLQQITLYFKLGRMV